MRVRLLGKLAARGGNKKVFVERSRYRGNVTSAVKSGAVETPVL
jgi:hypothetical protein